MVDFPNPPQWLRGLASKIAASTAVPDKAALVTGDDGSLRVGDGSTQIKNLPKLLDVNTANGSYAPIEEEGSGVTRYQVDASGGVTLYAADGVTEL